MSTLNLDSIIKSLERSALFNLSLSSKELFHSNFIAWLCKKYPIKLGEIIMKYINKNHNIKNTEIKNVERENRNLDLTFKINEATIIIENKVKSIPDKIQLQKYREKTKGDCIYILLTLISPSFPLKNWKLLTYSDLAEILSILLTGIDQDEQYHKWLIHDYIKFIESLTKLTKYLTIDIKHDKYNFYGHDFKLFKDIRLHDLYLKHKYHQLAVAICDNLNKIDYTGTNVKEVLVAKKYSYKDHFNKIVISPHIVNGKGVLNIDFSSESELTYGIMLDGNRYNHYTASWGKKGKQKRDIGKNLRKEKIWFDFSFVDESDSYPKNGKDFNKYEPNIIYRSVKINSELNLSELQNIIQKDIIKMIRINTDKFIGIE